MFLIPKGREVHKLLAVEGSGNIPKASSSSKWWNSCEHKCGIKYFFAQKNVNFKNSSKIHLFIILTIVYSKIVLKKLFSFDVQPLLLISLDGFRPDYLHKRGIMPALARIAECGSSGAMYASYRR